MPGKKIDTVKSTLPKPDQNLRRRPSKPRVMIDASVSEPGLPTAIVIPTESETDLLSAIEIKIRDPSTATLHRYTQTGVSKLDHTVDYGKFGLDFDFLLACDVDLYVRCQKENVTFEQIESELGKGVVYDFGDKPKPKPVVGECKPVLPRGPRIRGYYYLLLLLLRDYSSRYRLLASLYQVFMILDCSFLYIQ